MLLEVCIAASEVRRGEGIIVETGENLNIVAAGVSLYTDRKGQFLDASEEPEELPTPIVRADGLPEITFLGIPAKQLYLYPPASWGGQYDKIGGILFPVTALRLWNNKRAELLADFSKSEEPEAAAAARDKKRRPVPTSVPGARPKVSVGAGLDEGTNKEEDEEEEEVEGAYVGSSAELIEMAGALYSKAGRREEAPVTKLPANTRGREPLPRRDDLPSERGPGPGDGEEAADQNLCVQMEMTEALEGTANRENQNDFGEARFGKAGEKWRAIMQRMKEGRKPNWWNKKKNGKKGGGNGE